MNNGSKNTASDHIMKIKNHSSSFDNHSKLDKSKNSSAHSNASHSPSKEEHNTSNNVELAVKKASKTQILASFSKD
eukprot:4483152-Ditylum_brightwellii.AAC.1